MVTFTTNEQRRAHLDNLLKNGFPKVPPLTSDMEISIDEWEAERYRKNNEY